jgi:hypothetical protein
MYRLPVKVRHEGRFVVIGLDVPLAGACSLLLAARAGYVGRCESGVNRRVVADLRGRCTLLSGPVCEGAERSRGGVWIVPQFAVEVQYNAR